jgi:hypothetical protein
MREQGYQRKLLWFDWSDIVLDSNVVLGINVGTYDGDVIANMNGID